MVLPGDIVRLIALMILRSGDRKGYFLMRGVCQQWHQNLSRVPPPPPMTPFLHVLSTPHYHWKKTVCCGCLVDINPPRPAAQIVWPYCEWCEGIKQQCYNYVVWGKGVSLQFVARLIRYPHYSLQNKYIALGWMYANNCDELDKEAMREFRRSLVVEHAD